MKKQFKRMLVRLSAVMLLENNRKTEEIRRNSAEQVWAFVYRDSIRGKSYLEELPLNIGRWAAGYPFFYALNRILHDYKPKSILEFGLGESSKFISTVLDHFLVESTQMIVEHDRNWIKRFEETFVLSARSEIQPAELKSREVQGFATLAYDGIEKKLNGKYDLYVIDGPFGSDHFSRFNIVDIAGNFEKEDEFIIILDDFNRPGEKQTFDALLEVLKAKDIEIHTGRLSGAKDLAIVATAKYKFVATL